MSDAFNNSKFKDGLCKPTYSKYWNSIRGILMEYHLDIAPHLSKLFIDVHKL